MWTAVPAVLDATGRGSPVAAAVVVLPFSAVLRWEIADALRAAADERRVGAAVSSAAVAQVRDLQQRLQESAEEDNDTGVPPDATDGMSLIRAALEHAEEQRVLCALRCLKRAEKFPDGEEEARSHAEEFRLLRARGASIRRLFGYLRGSAADGWKLLKDGELRSSYKFEDGWHLGRGGGHQHGNSVHGHTGVQ
eukprot:Hpha_TRINITY_DN23909_c0_g1::TRINITY_DN23909_c0_g1_i1::g.137791::m.137791